MVSDTAIASLTRCQQTARRTSEDFGLDILVEMM